MDHRRAIIKALDLYDEADQLKRITSGETLAFWEGQLSEAEEELKSLMDDIGAVQSARHALFSPTL